MTQTLVNFTKLLVTQKDYFKDHKIWNVLEAELFRRRRNLNNPQLAEVMFAFGITGNGSKDFFVEMEEVITDSPIFIESEYLIKIM